MSPPLKKTKLDSQGVSDEANPDIFNINAMPEQPKELKKGQLPADQIRHYFEKVRKN